MRARSREPLGPGSIGADPRPLAPRSPGGVGRTPRSLRPGTRRARLRGVTESRIDDPKPATGAAARSATPAKSARPAPTRASNAATPARAARPKAVAEESKDAPSSGSARPDYRHPNLGLAPIDMTAGYAAAAEKVRGSAPGIAVGALEAALKADPTIRTRYDQVGLRRLLRDGQLLVERLAMCLAGGEARWLTEYAEWIGPIYRRRGVPLNDLSVLCAGIRETVEAQLSADEFAAAARSLDAAGTILRLNGRVGGDRHKRNALSKWMYRGV